MLVFAPQMWETFVFHVMRSSSVCYIRRSQSPLTFKEKCERGGFIDWVKKWNVWFMFSHKQRVNLCHWIHMLGLSQHLFAEQNCDLVMTSGNVSFQQRRSSEFGGELAGEGGETVRGKPKKKKKRKAQDEEQWKGLCSKVPVVSQLWVHVLIIDVAWGEWRTNSGSWARWGLLIMRFELAFNPKPLWALCLLLLTPHW